MADNNKKQYIKYEDTTYILEDSRLPDPTSDDNGKVLGVVDGEYALKQEEGGGDGAVTSVNGKTGAVTITAAELGALTEHQSLAAYRTASAQDTIDAAQDQAIGAKYAKPSGGIPASDLADAVKTSLGKADTALQEHQSLSGYATESWVQQQGYLTQHQDISGKADKIPRVVKTAQDETVTLQPNVEYYFPEMANLAVTLAAPTDLTILNEYHFFFTSGATSTVFSFNDGDVRNAGELPDNLDADKLYEVSVLEGLALITPHTLDAEEETT